MNSFSTIGTPLYGGDLTVRGRMDLGRRTEMNIRQDVRSDPFFTLGAFNSLQQEVTDQTVTDQGNGLASSSINALTDARSLILDTRASLQ